MTKSSYLITGAAGFIGFHVTQRLLAEGKTVVGIDAVNDYYDPQLKRDRLAQLERFPNFEFVQMDIADKSVVDPLFASHAFQVVVHLAAQAGVRYSIDNPHAYVQSNLVGFANVLEACRRREVEHLLFASSSSVYGANEKMPYSTRDRVDHPISLYAATKKSNELMAHAYSHLFGLPCTGLRFFTAYGPWGRPDMAYFLFTSAILEGRSIDVYDEGKMWRDFTYIDDIVEGVVRLIHKIPIPDPDWDSNAPHPASSGVAPYRLFNIGNNRPIQVLQLVRTLEDVIGIEAKKNFKPAQPGDVQATFAEIDDLKSIVGFSPSTDLQTGIERFVAWYRAYYRVSA